MLAASADDQLRVVHPGLKKAPYELLLAAGRESFGRPQDLSAPAVVDRDVQGQPLVPVGQRLRAVHLLGQLLGDPLAGAEETDPDPVTVKLWGLAGKAPAKHSHQRGDLRSEEPT